MQALPLFGTNSVHRCGDVSDSRCAQRLTMFVKQKQHPSSV